MVVEATAGSAADLIPAVRSTLQRLEPDVPIQIATMDSLVSTSLAQRRFVMMLLGGFSLTALLLAVVGIYGVVSYSVARRTREMGIRMALGADGGSVRAMVVKGAMSMVAGGLLMGVLGALGLTRVLSSLLYQVSPRDPLTLGGAVILLAGAALVASWLPARAGTRVDPMVSLRTE